MDEEISLFSSAKPAPNKTKSKPKKKRKLADDQEEKTENASHTTEEGLESFEDLGLKDWLVNTCRSIGYKNPTSIQKKCIPSVLEGKHVIGSAETGSGKTAAFALPILQSLAKDPFGVFALVITPTRELAIQISEQFDTFGTKMGLKKSVVIGGLDMIEQAIQVGRRPHVVVATPGRLLALLSDNPDLSPCFSRLRFLVLDEADRLLTGTLIHEINELLEFLPKKNKQILLFSATLNFNANDNSNNSKTNTNIDSNSSKKINSVVEKLITFDSKPVYHIDQPKLYQDVKQLDQMYMFMPNRVKDCYLIYLIKSNPDVSIIVFTATCYSCELIKGILTEMNVVCVNLHSKMSQFDRIKSIEKFKSKYVQVLVATDVASRGLDIPYVDLVINYDVPRDVVDYIHRVGRTARAQRHGKSVTLVSQYDVDLVHNIENVIGKKLIEYEANEDEILSHLTETSSVKTLCTINLEEKGFKPKQSFKVPRQKNNKSKKKETQSNDRKRSRHKDRQNDE